MPAREARSACSMVDSQLGTRMYGDVRDADGSWTYKERNRKPTESLNTTTPLQLNTNSQLPIHTSFQNSSTMHLSTVILAATLALTSSTTASPLAPRQNTILQDWQVFGVAVGTPSGRPGSYPWASITANVTDPNEYNLGPAKSDGSDVVVPGRSQGIVCLSFFYPSRSPPVKDF
jgi:hypothetical protein